MKYYLKLLSLPLTLLVGFISLFIIWRVFELPPAEVIIERINVLFESYGLIIFFVSAFIEGILLFGGYFPGVFIIFVSVVSASSLSEALIRMSISTAGLLCAHSLNYVLGKYGWYRLLVRFGLRSPIEDAKTRLLKRGTLAIFASYWLPSISTLTDTAAGILQMPFRKFISASLLASIFWNLLVGLIVYFVGEKILIIATSGGTTELSIQLSIVIIWASILLILDFQKKRKSPLPN
jgi:membrane protein DedA with SNARE-associated domain